LTLFLAETFRPFFGAFFLLLLIGMMPSSGLWLYSKNPILKRSVGVQSSNSGSAIYPLRR
jgi:hypothetical protein